MTATGTLALRLATHDDIPALKALMALSIRGLMPAFLTPDQVDGSFETMGVDTLLIDDGTYFVVEDSVAGIVGCGGWGKRATLYGGDQTAGRDDRLQDPASEAARIRAMYTHPDHARRGIGRMVIEAGETAARAHGFSRIQLGATLAGAPLYRAVGFEVIDRHERAAANGAIITLLVMEKAI
jgi:GNAT superfamily N-acetyltransferase